MPEFLHDHSVVKMLDCAENISRSLWSCGVLPSSPFPRVGGGSKIKENTGQRSHPTDTSELENQAANESTLTYFSMPLLLLDLFQYIESIPINIFDFLDSFRQRLETETQIFQNISALLLHIPLTITMKFISIAN